LTPPIPLDGGDGMKRSLTLACALVLGAGLLGAAGCGPRYVEGTKVEYTAEKQRLADLIERYRLAMEQRDVEALRALASRDYYENGSTTTDPADDYGYDGLERLFVDVKNNVKDVKYTVEIKEIRVMAEGESAHVDLEYTGQYLFTIGERDRWETVTDKNRLTLRKEDGNWRIISGM
jgi:ketosteroid isomerase-like protein